MTGKGQLKCSECHFAHHKSHVGCSGIKPMAQPLTIITLLLFKIRGASQWLIQVTLIHTWRVVRQCVHTYVPATDSAWRSLYHRSCRWRGADVRGHASSVASGCTNYLTPWNSLGEGTCEVMIMFGMTQASPFECYDWPCYGKHLLINSSEQWVRSIQKVTLQVLGV
jgi:hypothetical protein